MKSILITGCTDGIGKLATEKLYGDGHSLILVGRNKDKLEKLVKTLQSKSTTKVHYIVCDLSDLQSLNVVSNYLDSHSLSLDVIINNAGVFKSEQLNNKDGLDLRFVVNYLAPYILTRMTLPYLEKSTDKRIINLSSAAQESVSLSALEGNTTLSAQMSYAQSKLALTMWSFELGKQLDNTAVIPVNPGSLLNTKMVREAYGRYWSPASKGANIIHALATDNQYAGVTGKYFDNDLGDNVGRFGPAHSDAYDTGRISDLLTTTDKIIENLKG